MSSETPAAKKKREATEKRERKKAERQQARAAKSTEAPASDPATAREASSSSQAPPPEDAQAESTQGFLSKEEKQKLKDARFDARMNTVRSKPAASKPKRPTVAEPNVSQPQVGNPQSIQNENTQPEVLSSGTSSTQLTTPGGPAPSTPVNVGSWGGFKRQESPSKPPKDSLSGQPLVHTPPRVVSNPPAPRNNEDTLAHVNVSRKSEYFSRGPEGSANKPLAPIAYYRKPTSQWLHSKPAEIYTNHFLVRSFPKNGTVYHYDVSIQKESDGKDCPPEVNAQIMRNLHKAPGSTMTRTPYAFDGRRNLFTIGTCFDEQNLVVKHPNMPEVSIKVFISHSAESSISEVVKYLESKDYESPTALVIKTLTAFEAFFRSTPSNYALDPSNKFIAPVKGIRKFFARNQEAILHFEQGTIGLMEATFQSLRPGIKDLYVNVDVSQNCFKAWNISFQELAARLEHCKQGMPDPERLRLYKTHWKGLKYFCLYRKATWKTFVVDDVVQLSPSSHKFKYRDTETGIERMVTVSEYLQKKYGIKLNYPTSRFMLMNIVTNRTTQRKTNSYVPLELAFVKEGQLHSANDKETAQVIRHIGSQDAHERKRNIERVVKALDWGQDRALTEHFSVSQEMTKCNGRQLDPPKISYNGPRGKIDHYALQSGSWAPKLGEKKFCIGAKIVDWAICNFDHEIAHRGSSEVLKDFSRKFSGEALKLGCTIPATPRIIEHLNVATTEQHVKEFCQKFLGNRKGKDCLIVFVLHSHAVVRNGVYDIIKRVCHCNFGVNCTVILAARLKRFTNLIATNVFQKINPMFESGVNFQLDLSTVLANAVNDTMFIGIDVTHPPPNEPEKMSVAAVVASVDSTYTKYAARISVQPRTLGPDGVAISTRMEPVRDLQLMMMALLQIYQRKMKRLPTKIIVWRDGVGEGQFPEILAKEVSAIKDACRSVSKTSKPPLVTFCVVQKRHHTRLFPASLQGKRSSYEDPRGNCKPGIFVDEKIVAPNTLNFYGVSHKAILGTAVPVHYQILYDDNKFTTEKLMMLAFFSCYGLCRATSSVSMPAACYYAHIVSKKAPSYLDHTDERNPKLREFHPSIKDTMWFN